MELLLNVAWVALSCASLLGWALWRGRSGSSTMPGLLRGMLVVACVLALLFPVISISDDLSQAVGLAEGNRLQDVFKAPDLRLACSSAALVSDLPASSAMHTPVFTRDRIDDTPASFYDLLRTPGIDKRPPPAA